MNNNTNLEPIWVISKCMVNWKKLPMEIRERICPPFLAKCNAKPPYKMDMASSHEHMTHRIYHMMESHAWMCDMHPAL
jgi:hypothetical protein